MKLFGNRCLVQLVEEEYGGLVVIPKSTQQNFVIAKVSLVSDEAAKAIDVEAGDTVLFQAPDHLIKSSSYVIHGKSEADNKIMMSTHPHDILAKLSSTSIKLDSITAAGRWVILKIFLSAVAGGTIVLPENIHPVYSQFSRFKLVNAGQRLTLPIEPGDELIVNRDRLVLIQLEGIDYAFAPEEGLIGVVEDTGLN